MSSRFSASNNAIPLARAIYTERRVIRAHGSAPGSKVAWGDGHRALKGTRPNVMSWETGSNYCVPLLDYLSLQKEKERRNHQDSVRGTTPQSVMGAVSQPYSVTITLQSPRCVETTVMEVSTLLIAHKEDWASTRWSKCAQSKTQDYTRPHLPF